MSRAPFFALLLTGCWPLIPPSVRDEALGGDDTDTGSDTSVDDTGLDTDTGFDSDTDTGFDTDTDTGQVPFLEPEIWWVDGGFGWTGTGIRDYGVQTNSGEARQPAWILVSLARQSYLTTPDEADRCWVYLQMGTTPWYGITDDEVWLGGTASTYVGTNCGDEAHPMRSDLWGTSPGISIAEKGWQAAIGPLASDLAAALDGNPNFEPYEPYMLGGRVASSVLAPMDDGSIVLGYEVEPTSFTMLEDTGGNPVPIPASEVTSEVIPVGAWVVSGVWVRTDPAVLQP